MGSESDFTKQIFRAGFLLAVMMIRDSEDKYGIGSMCSQWTGEEIAEDMLKRAGYAEDALQ